jgi:coenzyme PQQ precursor peptide PqqA
MPGGRTVPAPVWQNKAKSKNQRESKRKLAIAWTTPTLVEICIGLEINGYLPAEI